LSADAYLDGRGAGARADGGVIVGEDELDSLFAKPADFIVAGVTDRLFDCHLPYVEEARFFCVATGSTAGLNVSPRGGSPGCVQVLGPQSIAFADWPGNNKIYGLRDIVRDDRVAILFLYAGLDVFLRINGRAIVTRDAAIRGRLAEGSRVPRLAIVVTVEKVLFHCGRAIKRSDLWDDAGRHDPGSLPSIGVIYSEIAKMKESVADIDALYQQDMARDPYS
jgi:PPOX class probable FMN-dependent enzyme